MKQLITNRRRLRLAAGAVVAGAALFASGVLVANAMDSGDGSDDGGSGAATDTPLRTFPSGSAPAGLNPLTDAGDSGRAAEDDAARSSLPRGGGCQAPIPGVLAEGRVDPAAAGFTASYLGAAFQLTSFTMRAEADCPDGVTPSGETDLVVDTGWKHTETGLSVYVTQRQDAEATASVLEETLGRFSRDGYTFAVSVDSYSVQPLAGRDGGPAIADDLVAGVDPRAGAVLQAALADLNAPEAACFYTVRQGAFDDLAAMGIGDPRSAIPGGYSVEDVQVRAWSAPTIDCGNASTDGLFTSFHATWVRDGGDYEAIFASASSVAKGEPSYPGNSSEYYASWSNGTFHFNVGVKSASNSGDADVLRAIALAMDPGFANACLAQEGERSDADLVSAGFALPSAPDDYSITGREHRGSSLTGNCSPEAREQYSTSLSGNWMMTGPDGAVIAVNAYNAGDVPGDERRGYISDNNISFFAGSVQYNISGYNERGGNVPEPATLIEVARSIDPAFDPDSLEKVPGGGTAPGNPVRPIAEDAKPR